MCSSVSYLFHVNHYILDVCTYICTCSYNFLLDRILYALPISLEYLSVWFMAVLWFIDYSDFHIKLLNN